MVLTHRGRVLSSPLQQGPAPLAPLAAANPSLGEGDTKARGGGVFMGFFTLNCIFFLMNSEFSLLTFSLCYLRRKTKQF